MDIVISYSLFEQMDKKYNRTGHDPFDRMKNRYWVNIPAIVIVNRIAFPKSTTFIYVPKSLENNRMFRFLEKLDKLPYVSVRKIDKPYTGTEPTMWRLKALWEAETSYCFCRDLDSIMVPKEIQAMWYFMRHPDYLMHNIRSIPQHNGEGTSLMAGLNGFNIRKLKTELPLPESFSGYEKFYRKLVTKPHFIKWRNDLAEKDKSGQWGCDQDMLINFFIRTRPADITKKLLDVYIQPDRRRMRGPFAAGHVTPNRHYKVTSMDESVCNAIDISYIGQDILSMIGAISTWAGEPVNSSPNLKMLLKLKRQECSDMHAVLSSDEMFRSIYQF